MKQAFYPQKSNIKSHRIIKVMQDQLQQVTRMEPRQCLRSSSSPVLVVPATRRLSLADRAFLVTAANSHYCVNPAFMPSSPENSSIHCIFPIILVTFLS